MCRAEFPARVPAARGRGPGGGPTLRRLAGWALAGACAGALPPAGAADRALIMTIGTYAGDVAPPLPGVGHDRASAMAALARMGFAPSQTVLLSDEALDAAGIHRAFEQLVADTGPDDRVFVYFSGHGSSRTVDGRCEQALLAHDGTPVGSAEIARHLEALGDRASRVVVMFDACFSGGVAGAPRTRSGRDGTTLRAKFVARGGDACAEPTNLLAERLPATRSARGAVNLERNYLYVAAARDDEVAFDDERTGGMATSALLACLTGSAGAADTDGSGAVSFRELTACAQRRVEAVMPPDPRLKPQHLVTVGNADMTAASAEPVAAASESVAAGPRAAAADAAPARPLATLRDLLAGADARWTVEARAEPPALAIGRDALRLTVTSARDAYLYVLYVGSDQRAFQLLYPARPDDPHRLVAGQPFELPRQWRSKGPAGSNHVLVIASPTARDFSGLGTTALPATTGSAARLRTVLCTRSLAAGDCGGGAEASGEAIEAGLAGGPAPGSSTYGAVLLRVDERG